MAGVPLKFRCYRCNQLLGVSRSKVGATVPCPKCKAELIVPEPTELSPALESQGTESAAGAQALDAGGVPLAPELFDIHPEDIRVEPGVELHLDLHAPSSPVAEEPPRFDSVLRRTPVEASPAPPLAEEILISEPSPVPAGEPPVSPTADMGPVVPPIRVEPSRGIVDRTPVARSRDVVLPRSAVAAWSLFVLMAQGLAFLAGLLAGHFIWKVH